jgi:hypothetical protein
MPSGTPQLTVQVVPHAKPWWTSRTLIFNALALALLMAESQLQMLQPVLPVNAYAVAAFALPIVNLVLRTITTTSIALPDLSEPKPPAKEDAT